tara:strand:- start:359 stop:541 length:183 start_codon:yes stop_codon:yes gene_type:complete
MVRWKVILEKDYGEVVVDYFDSKREAQAEIKNRYNLCKTLGYDPDLLYKIVKETGSPKIN